ncbi:nudix hydrolase 16, mitochondrial-like isoform X2 [Magnolia sinica]|uniref:nudix hydrolase 16, mitochondrial-like isoform X2 n=1 Tax=Magnolia sinica TaxID=86752 RepID=UPI00265A1F5E|nr:nudix hydrolase 16, mitochondrial-like isoform X2 [Magnolia sinica]
MTDLVARTGRLQQRYEAGCRLVAGCIPFKYRNSDENCDSKPEKVVEVLMINSQSGPGLLFPKGGWENDETVEEAAVREALEEAGVRGEIMVDFHKQIKYGWDNLLMRVLNVAWSLVGTKGVTRNSNALIWQHVKHDIHLISFNHLHLMVHIKFT